MEGLPRNLKPKAIVAWAVVFRDREARPYIFGESLAVAFLEKCRPRSQNTSVQIRTFVHGGRTTFRRNYWGQKNGPAHVAAPRQMQLRWPRGPVAIDKNFQRWRHVEAIPVHRCKIRSASSADTSRDQPCAILKETTRLAIISATASSGGRTSSQLHQRVRGQLAYNLIQHASRKTFPKPSQWIWKGRMPGSRWSTD